MRLTILADQFGSSTGGGRFIEGFLRALLTDQIDNEKLEAVSILATEREPTSELKSFSSKVHILNRRFPSRLRNTFLEKIVGHTMPPADIAHGPFFYVFPSLAKHTVITIHDVSFLNDWYHDAGHNAHMRKAVYQQIKRCSAIVCDSNEVLQQLKEQWPMMAHKYNMIYPGADDLRGQTENIKKKNNSEYILAVGTIEPRKNYARLLEAYDLLREAIGARTPQLVVVGKPGWMSTDECRRLSLGVAGGWIRWHQNANDAELACLYSEASVFTYLSLYEGFGFPPFEAARIGVPMVVSSVSTVGEIWQGHARCVNPTSIEEIVAGWQWALGLDQTKRQYVIEQQRTRAAEFSWERCITEHIKLYEHLMSSG